jgi:hypothetical protein
VKKKECETSKTAKKKGRKKLKAQRKKSVKSESRNKK